ncbi:Tetraspanin-5 [Halotydeus destructor]|nr:Tetraspanin-5 [Halotydeus destructor]
MMFQPLTWGNQYTSAGSLVGTHAVLTAIPMPVPTPPPPAPSCHSSHSSVARAPSLTAVHLSQPPGRPKKTKSQSDKSEISCCLKYLIFGSNVLFWTFGLTITIVGMWAWAEKDTFSNFSRIANLTLDPAFLLIVAGSVGFLIGFTGCLGALRENTCLLASYAIFLAILLLLEMSAGILGFIFRDWTGSKSSGSSAAASKGPKDWDMNIYFNCSSIAQGSREACGVPFSCCRPGQDDLLTRNKQCGYDVRKADYSGDKSAVIFEKGCLRAGEEWIEANLIPVAAVTVVVALLQILGICFAQNLRADIFAQRAKWH